MATFCNLRKKIRDNPKMVRVERERERERENKGVSYCQICNQDERVILGCNKGISRIYSAYHNIYDMSNQAYFSLRQIEN